MMIGFSKKYRTQGATIRDLRDARRPFFSQWSPSWLRSSLKEYHKYADLSDDLLGKYKFKSKE
jgi:hypothetical protein